MNRQAFAAADLVAPDDDANDDEAAASIAPPAGRLHRAAGLLRRALKMSSGERRYDGTDLTPRRLVRALSRQSRALALQRLRRLPCFRADEYLQAYSDVLVARMDPHFHALFVGGFEERKLFRAETLAKHLGAALPPASPALPPARPARVGLYVSSLGNIFMREIAEDVAAGLLAAGAQPEMLDETAPIERRPPLSVFVAPHEFFFLGRGVEWVRDDVVAGSVMLNTEQPQTRWFGRSLPFLMASRGVIDLCPQSAALFGAASMPSLHLSPAPHLPGGALREEDRRHPLFRVLPEAARVPASAATPFSDRPLDFCFFGTESRHREEFLAHHAAALAEFEAVVHYRREDRGPIRPGTPDGALTRLAQHVSGHAKIVLNLHRDAFGYLEWHRIVRLGFTAGAVVVSEPCLPHPLLVPEKHYFEAASRQIPGLLAWLTGSADGRRAAAGVQANARALLADVVTPGATGASVLAFLHAHASQ